MRAQWEEKLAAYVKTSFAATMLGTRRPAGHSICQQAHHRRAAAVRRQGGDRRRAHGRRARRLQHDRRAGGAADPPPVADLAGFPAGPDLDRAARRHSQSAARARAADATCAADAARRHRIPQRHLPLPAGRAEVLKNVSLVIQPGETIGIVGPSGSGKSTLTKLVQRLYPPSEGQVFLDGADLSQVDPAWLRSHIGVVLQENLLFNRTIHENIAFANPAMPRAQVIEIARLAGADEFIDKLPRRLRHHDRGARRQSVRRPAPAHRHRPGARDQSAHSHPRRGDRRRSTTRANTWRPRSCSGCRRSTAASSRRSAFES